MTGDTGLSHPTVARLREVFSYDEETGRLTWRVSRGRAKVGKLVGGLNIEGYRSVTLDGITLLAHRIIWAIKTGSWPAKHIDHKNGDRDDNRFCNLRECMPLENMQNYPTPAHNSSGYVGVSKCSANGKWQVHIRCGWQDGKKRRLFLGFFKDRKEAALAYARKKAEMHSFNPITRDGIHAN